MIENHINSQPDLFSESASATNQKTSFSNSFFGCVRSYEKIIILSFCFIITGIISFSIGVEKGKRVALNRQDARFDVANNVQPASKKLALTQELIRTQNNTPLKQTQAPVPATQSENVKLQAKTGKYAIQLASYQSKVLAQKEADSLKKRGLMPFFFSKKGYTVLCVGGFTSKNSAQQMLTELKKKYHDGFVRRL